MAKPLVELLLNQQGIPVDIVVSEDVTIVCRFTDIKKVFVPNPKVDPTLRERFMSSPKMYGEL